MSGRDPYADAGAAARLAIERASEAGCRPQDRYVLDAVIHETSTYSRLSDRISLARLAELAKIKGKRPEKEVAQSLKRLVAIGAATYEPGIGRTRSKVGLPMVSEVASEGGTGTPVSDQRGALVPPSNGGTGTPLEGGTGTPLPEKSYEKSSEKRSNPVDRNAQTSGAPIGMDEVEARAHELRRLQMVGEATTEQHEELDRLLPEIEARSGRLIRLDQLTPEQEHELDRLLEIEQPGWSEWEL